MPALPSVPGVLRFTIEGNTPLFPWVNVLYWNYTGAAPTGSNCGAFADQLYSTWVTEFAPHMLTASHILKATCTDLTSPTSASGESSAITPGSAGTVEVPASCSVLISKTIGRRYRGGHPRLYLFAGIQTDLADSCHWGASLTTAIDGGYSALVAAMNGFAAGAATLGTEQTVSYVDKAVNPVSPFRRAVPLVLPVLGHAVEALVAYQRRRGGR